jgi:protein ImuB
MLRRVLSIWCANLAIDRWRLAAGEGADALPTALIAETAHGPRIEAVNAAARQAGAQAMMRLTDARAICPELIAAPADPAGDSDFLERLALWAQRWGPWSALDPPDGVIVDVTGVSHLFGGEAALLADVGAQITRRGLAAQAAIAPTAGAAWALTHFGPQHAILQPGDNLAELPVAALRLDPAVLLVLRRLGLKRIGDIDGLSRPALARRFRNRHAPAANPLIRLDQLIGRVPEPLLPVIGYEAPLVQRRLMEPIRHRELLDRVLADLADDMARLLEARGEGARRIELGLWRVDGEVVIRRVEMAQSSRDAGHIVWLIRGRLDDVDAGFGIEMARMRAPWCEPLLLTQRDLDSAAEERGTSLAACIDRLVNRLGEAGVRSPLPYASHIPERAQCWESLLGAAGTSVPALRHRPAPPPGHPEHTIPLGAFRRQPSPQAAGERAGAVSSREAGQRYPIKLLNRPEPISVLYATPDGLPRRFRWRGALHEVARVDGPERIAPEWWRERSSARLRDYYRIEDHLGRRYWIYRAGLIGDGRGPRPETPPEWFLQGLYA